VGDTDFCIFRHDHSFACHLNAELFSGFKCIGKAAEKIAAAGGKAEAIAS